MSKTPDENLRELETILDRVCDQTATVAQRQRLNELLAGDPTLREPYLAQMRLQAALAWHYMPGKPFSIEELQRISVAESVMDKIEDKREKRRRNDKTSEARSGGSDEEVLQRPRAAGHRLPTTARSSSPVLGFLRGTMRMGGDFRLNSWPVIAVLAGLFLILSLVAIVPAYLSLRRAELENAQREQRDEQERQLAATQAQESELARKLAESKPKPPPLLDVYARLFSERNPLHAARAVGDSVAWVYAHGLGQARLTFAVDCRWRGAVPDVGEALTLGRRLVLKSGLAEIVFQNGARTILQGPSTLEIRSGSGAFLQVGRYTVNVEDPRAKGFEVGTPGMKYTDLGTEFGVMVDANGDQEMHVFRGTVLAEVAEVRDQRSEVSDQKPGDLQRPTSDLRPLTFPSLPPATRPMVVSAHQAVRVAAPAEPGKPATPIEPIASDDKQFVRKEQLSKMLGERSPEFRHWKQFSERLSKRVDLVAYYDFQPDESDRTVLRNRAATGAQYDGRIVSGAEWCEGRFAGKRALELQQPAAGVRVKFDAKLREATVVACVRINDLFQSGEQGSDRNILGSDRWAIRPGMMHWRILHSRLSLAVCDTAGNATPGGVTNEVNAGLSDSWGIATAWHFLATTCDLSTGKVFHYVDGRAVGEGTLKGDAIDLGEATIGNWNHLGTPPAEDRPLRGRMDELIILRTALPPAAIKEMYEAPTAK